MRLDPDKVTRRPFKGTCLGVKLHDDQQLLLQFDSRNNFSAFETFWVFSEQSSREPIFEIGITGEEWEKLYQEERVVLLPFGTFPEPGTIEEYSFLPSLICSLRLQGQEALPSDYQSLCQALHAAYIKLDEDHLLLKKHRVDLGFSLSEDGHFTTRRYKGTAHWYSVMEAIEDQSRFSDLLRLEYDPKVYRPYGKRPVSIIVSPQQAKEQLITSKGGHELWEVLATTFIEKLKTSSEMAEAEN